MKTTVQEFAKAQNIPAPTANAVLAWLRQKGVAKIVEVVRQEGQLKGKGKNVFEIADEFTVDLTKVAGG